MQQVEEVAAFGARIDLPSIRQQLNMSAAAGGLEQAHTESVSQDLENLMQLMDAEASSAEVGQHEQLE